MGGKSIGVRDLGLGSVLSQLAKNVWFGWFRFAPRGSDMARVWPQEDRVLRSSAQSIATQGAKLVPGFCKDGRGGYSGGGGGDRDGFWRRWERIELSCSSVGDG